MIVEVFEVYSEDSNSCIMFLTKEEARSQNIISNCYGPYPAYVELTEVEYVELKQKRYAWN